MEYLKTIIFLLLFQSAGFLSMNNFKTHMEKIYDINNKNEYPELNESYENTIKTYHKITYFPKIKNNTFQIKFDLLESQLIFSLKEKKLIIKHLNLNDNKSIPINAQDLINQLKNIIDLMAISMSFIENNDQESRNFLLPLLCEEIDKLFRFNNSSSIK
jgi:hypothetical protein